MNGVVRFMALMGLICCIGGSWLIGSTATFRRTAARAQGHAIDILTVRPRDEGVSHSLRIRFRSAGGDILVVGRRLTTNPFFWPRDGSSVEVLYESGNPQRARLNDFPDLWLVPLMLCGFGGILLAVAGLKLQGTATHYGRGQSVEVKAEL